MSMYTNSDFYSVPMIDIMPIGYEFVAVRVDDASQMLVFNEVYDDDPPRLEIYSSIKALGRNLNIKYRTIS